MKINVTFDACSIILKQKTQWKHSSSVNLFFQQNWQIFLDKILETSQFWTDGFSALLIDF